MNHLFKSKFNNNYRPNIIKNKKLGEIRFLKMLNQDLNKNDIEIPALKPQANIRLKT